MIAVDVNVVAYLLIQGESTELAQAVWHRDPDWYVPLLWRHEYLNVLATYVKAGGATLEEAEALWGDALRLLAPGEREVHMESALALAAEKGISAYDAQYVVLASSLGVPLVTADRRLRQAFPGQILAMQEFCASEGAS